MNDKSLFSLEAGMIEGHYAIQPNIEVFCRLEPMGSSDNSGNFVAAIGIRRDRDAKLSLGAKLNIFIKNGSENCVVYSTRVLKVSRADKVDLHILEAPMLLPQSAELVKPHIEIRVRAFLPEQFSMKDVMLSPGGLKFIYNSNLTSANIGKTIPVYLDCSDKTPFECRVSHILYNWWTTTHIVTAVFENLNERQEEIISRLIGPANIRIPEKVSLPLETADVALQAESITIYPTKETDEQGSDITTPSGEELNSQLNTGQGSANVPEMSVSPAETDIPGTQHAESITVYPTQEPDDKGNGTPEPPDKEPDGQFSKNRIDPSTGKIMIV